MDKNKLDKKLQREREKLRAEYADMYCKMKDITPASFGNKIAKAMIDISSSHVFFIMQQAYGDID